MKQSKWMSLAETLAQQLTGQVTTLVVLHLLYGTSVAHNLQFTLIMIPVSLVRGYLVRRAFERTGSATVEESEGRGG